MFKNGIFALRMKKIFEAILPGWTGHDKLPRAFPFYIRLVLQLSVVMVQIFSILNYGLPFGTISQQKRELLIKKLYHHPVPAIRNIVQWWKLLALTLQC
jgi:hypothetical protein